MLGETSLSAKVLMSHLALLGPLPLWWNGIPAGDGDSLARFTGVHDPKPNRWFLQEHCSGDRFSLSGIFHIQVQRKKTVIGLSSDVTGYVASTSI